MPENRGSQEEETSQPSWIVLRPPQLLMDLPLTFRWEVTRRHPYYLRFWEPAHRYHQQATPDPQQRLFEHAAVLLLRGIGVAADPPSPGSSWESLGGGDLSRAWRNGVVSPITLRGLVGLLLAALPPQVRADVANVFLSSACPSDDPQTGLDKGLTALTNLRHTELDSIPVSPVVGINIHAPQRIILQAVEEMVQQWKKERNLPERRRRDDKLEDYLAVWDLREGWRTDHYDGTQEKTLKEVARQLCIPLPTASNRYQSAFRLIVGHEYTPELWLLLFGSLKMHDRLPADKMPRRAGRRPWQSRHPRPVPESTLLAAADEERSEAGFLDALRVSPDEIAEHELFMDMREIIAKGRSNDEIMTELELAPEFVEVLDYLRGRDSDRS